MPDPVQDPREQGSDRPFGPELAQAVDHGLRALADFNQPRISPPLLSRQLANALAVRPTRLSSGPRAPAEATAAVRTACAQLTAGEVEEAFLSLLSARDVLAGQRAATGHPN